MHITFEQAQTLTQAHGSPLYIYDKSGLAQRARTLIALSLPFGHTVRYAIKANPHPEIIQLFDERGLHFDASSSYEADLLLKLGIAGNKISLSSQQPAHDLPRLLAAGVQYVATSLHQLALFTEAAAPGAHVALRVNAGVGSGHNNRTTTAGTAASFGLWHEHLAQALEFASSNNIIIDRLHTHIGSGADPARWGEAMETALSIAARMPDVTTLDIGGGYKVTRVAGEQEADMSSIAAVFAQKLDDFYRTTGRRLRLEIEPGTWLVAHAGTLLAEVVDIVDTGAEGYTFLRTNTGMNDFMRPTLYGAQHEIRVLSGASKQVPYVVVGHNCESGDILTPAPGDPEVIAPRLLKEAKIGDFIAIEDTGAYCASLRAVGYNAFPAAKEVFIKKESPTAPTTRPAAMPQDAARQRPTSSAAALYR